MLAGTILRRTRLLSTRAERAAFLAALFVPLWGLSRYDFAERDYLMFLFFAPYLVLVAARAANRTVGLRLALAAGLAGAFGLALKPYFVLPWLVLEVYLTVFRGRGWPWTRPEALAVVAFHALFAAFMLLFMPGYLDVVTMALRAYDAYDAPLAAILDKLLVFGPTAVVAVLAALLPGLPGARRELRRVLTLAVLGFIAVLFIQHKGFDYHYYPARAGGEWLLAVVVLTTAPLLLARTCARLRRRPLTRASIRRFVVACAMVVAASVTVQTGLALSAAARDAAAFSGGTFGRLSAELRQRAAGRPVVFLASNIWPAFPLYNYSGALWPTRWSFLWILPKYYQNAPTGPDGTIYRRREQMDDLERFQLDTFVDDFLRARPAFALVDVSPQKQGFGATRFDFLAYFLRDPRFRAAWGAYVYRGTWGPFAVFEQVGSG